VTKRMQVKKLIYTGALMAITMGLPAGLTAQGQSADHSQSGNQPDGRGDRTREAPPKSGTTGQVLTGNGINYNGGPVLRNGSNVYYIWYGNWSQDATANAILTDFASNIGGSPYFAINTSYGDTVGNVQNKVTYMGATSDPGSLGTSLSDGSIWTLVNNALSSKALPVDPNGVYFVLTAPYVAETSGFLTKYCGWHTYGSFGGTPIKYAFIGNAAANMGACSVQSTSPNGDAEADAMASVIAHELEESTTDPQMNAWYDSLGNENADKCAWTFGAEYAAPNGSVANMQLGSRNFLIQQNWVNANNGYCALSYVPSPDFSLSVSPASQSVVPGATTGSYVVTPVAVNGWSGTLTYSVTAGLPVGATAYVAGNAITVATTTGVAAGSRSLTIQGTDGTLTHTVGATLVVAGADFSLSVSPASQTVMPGNKTGNYTMTATALNGWTGTVTYSVTAGLPTGATAQVSGNVITVSTVTSVTPGSYNFTIQGTDGVRTHTVTATLVVSSPTFGIVFGPSSGNVARPSGSAVVTTTYQVTVTSIGGFSGTVNLTAGGATTGISLAMSSPSVAAGGSVTLTATVTSSAKKGNHTLTVTGTSGSITQSASASLKVN
jgi:hypothetical protein